VVNARENGLLLALLLVSGAWFGWQMADLPRPIRNTAAAQVAPGLIRHFTWCATGGGTNCVVDGDTFWIDGQKVRIADIDAPETHPPRCAHEAALGEAAGRRLQTLLNAGPVTIMNAEGRHDRYGRSLALVVRDGTSLGATLVQEGLARRWDGARHPWCTA